jgi:hypothetical protein
VEERLAGDEQLLQRPKQYDVSYNLLGSWAEGK